ncbi:major facilitator superfamily domain-containing protein [Peziza echinospora]|nr:major facilitator superfamily domain-containing protein [Peziza echinospora]
MDVGPNTHEDSIFDSDPTPRDSRTTSRAGSIALSEKQEITKIETLKSHGKGADAIDPEKVEIQQNDDAAILQAFMDNPPDGGWRAWSVAIGGHCVMLVTWGYANSFGFFQSHYLLTVPNTNSSSISLVGTIQLFCLFFVGTFSGQALDTGHYRKIYLAGSLLVLLGIFTTSFSHSYYQLFLSHGLCVGIGNGLLFIPTISLVATYFKRNRGLAIALSASGSATGGVIIPMLIQSLLPRLGFKSTIRILGGVVAFFLLLASLLLKTRLPPRRSPGLFDPAAFKCPPLLLFAAGIFLTSLGLFVPFYYVSTYTRLLQHPISDSSDLPTYVLVVMNAIGLPGRLIPGRIADTLTGPLTFITASTLICGVLILAWTAVTTLPGVWAFACIYGFFGSSIQSLLTSTTASMVTDMRRMGTWGGMMCCFVSFSCLAGNPIAGALVSRRGGVEAGVEAFRDAQVFAGVMMLAGGAVMFCARQLSTRGRWVAKV